MVDCESFVNLNKCFRYLLKNQYFCSTYAKHDCLTPSLSPKGEGSDGWFMIDGRKLDGKPTQKGIYINNGKKVVNK